MVSLDQRRPARVVEAAEKASWSGRVRRSAAAWGNDADDAPVHQPDVVVLGVEAGVGEQYVKAMATVGGGGRAVHRRIIGPGAAFDRERQTQVRAGVGDGRDFRKPPVFQAGSAGEVERSAVQRQARRVDRGVAAATQQAQGVAVLDGLLDQPVGIGLFRSRR